MKKVILFLMIATMSFVLSGCSNDEKVEYIDYSGVFIFSEYEMEDPLSEEIVSGIKIDKYLGTDQIVEIPNKINGLPVIIINNDFLIEDYIVHNEFVEVIIIPESVISIGSGDFRGAPNLTSVIISTDNDYNLSYRNGIYVKTESGYHLEEIQLGNQIDYELYAGTTSIDFSFNTYGAIKNLTIPEGTRVEHMDNLIYSMSMMELENIYLYQSDYDYYIDFLTNYAYIVSYDLIIDLLVIIDPS